MIKNIISQIKKIIKRKNFVNLKLYRNKRHYKKIKGLEIIFRGTNNSVIIGENCKFKNCKLEFWGDNITFKIGNNCNTNTINAIFSSSKNGTIINIGDNFFNTEKLQMYCGGNEVDNIYIGDNCLFSREIVIYAHDGHNIYNKTTNTVTNKPILPVKIGNNVWLGHGVTILKNVNIPNNTIIAAQSVVTKSFIEENTIIAGNIPKIVKHNVTWKQ